MAIENVIREAETAPEYLNFVSQQTYRMSELASLTRAARALLREDGDADSSDALTAVSFLLTRLAEDLDEISANIDGSSFQYERKQAQRQQEASHA